MMKMLKVSMIVAGMSLSGLTLSIAQTSNVIVPKLDKKVSQPAFLRDKLTNHTIGYVRIPSQLGMAFNIKNKASDKVMENNANERVILHLKKLLQDPSIVNEALRQHLSISLDRFPVDLGKLTSLIYTSVDGPIEAMAIDSNKMLSPATQILIAIPVNFTSAQELDEAIIQLFRQDIGLKNHQGFYPLSDFASMYFDARTKRVYISLRQKALSKNQLEDLIYSLKTTLTHQMYEYENQIDLTGQNLFAWLDISGSRDLAAQFLKAQSPILAEFVQNTEGLALGVGTTSNKLGQAKFITKTNTQKVSVLKGLANDLDFKTIGQPEHLAVIALPTKQAVIDFMAQQDVVSNQDIQSFEDQSQSVLSMKAVDLLDIFGPQVIDYKDDSGDNFAVGLRDKARFQQLIQTLSDKKYINHKVNKGIHEIKIANPLLKLLKNIGNEQNTADWENLGQEYALLQPLIAEIVSATNGIRALDVNWYIYWSEEQNWIILNTLPFALVERNKAKFPVAKWLDQQGIRSSGLIASYMGEIAGAEEKWYRDYLKFMRNNHDLLGQKFDLLSLPSPNAMKFNPTSRIGLHTAVDQNWVVASLDYDISPFYASSYILGQSNVAMFSILSSFALPAYQDYQNRVLVSEGIALSTAAKLASTEMYATTGNWPTDNEDAGLPDPELITSQGVKAIAIQDNGEIYIAYKDNIKYGGYLTLQSHTAANGSVQWQCYETNLPLKILPVSCRNDVTLK